MMSNASTLALWRHYADLYDLTLCYGGSCEVAYYRGQFHVQVMEIGTIGPDVPVTATFTIDEDEEDE